MRKILMLLTSWLWRDELHTLRSTARQLAARCAVLELSHLTLEDLFREKQNKISRLQVNYRNRTAPLREDLRTERVLGNFSDHMKLLEMVPERTERMRRGGFKGRPSDGTVEGVPFDAPNSEVDLPFDSPPPKNFGMQSIMTRGGNFTAAGAERIDE